MKHRALVLLVFVLAVPLAACSHASSTGGVEAAATTGAPPQVLVAFGSTAGYGEGLPDRLRDSWPQLLFRDAFPLSSVLMNLSDDPSPISGPGSAVSLELPVALGQHATIAAVWLGASGEGRCTGNTTATQFEPALTSLVEPLRDSGARVLIGNLPARVPCAVAFNAAVTSVARAQQATVADVASALSTTPTVGPDSLVTLAESRAIASAFGAAVARG